MGEGLNGFYIIRPKVLNLCYVHLKSDAERDCSLLDVTDSDRVSTGVSDES